MWKNVNAEYVTKLCLQGIFYDTCGYATRSLRVSSEKDRQFFVWIRLRYGQKQTRKQTVASSIYDTLEF